MILSYRFEHCLGAKGPAQTRTFLFLLMQKRPCDPRVVVLPYSVVWKAHSGSRGKGHSCVRSPCWEQCTRDSQKGWVPRPSRSRTLWVPVSSGPAGIQPRSLSLPLRPRGEGHVACSPAPARELPVTMRKETGVGRADPRTWPVRTFV